MNDPQAIFVNQKSGILNFEYVGCPDGSHQLYRGKSISKLIEIATTKSSILKDYSFSVNLDDSLSDRFDFSFSVDSENYNKGFPTYVVDCWECFGLRNYTEVVSAFNNSIPESNKVGWIGSKWAHRERKKFLSRFGSSYFSEGIAVNWKYGENLGDVYRNTPSFMSYQDQINRWKYMLDIQGITWSGRLPILLSMPRITFIHDRKPVEWWHQFLRPWVHFVPIQRDWGDFEKNYQIVEADPDLQTEIKAEQAKFARKYLTLEAALDRIATLIEKLD